MNRMLHCLQCVAVFNALRFLLNINLTAGSKSVLQVKTCPFGITALIDSCFKSFRGGRFFSFLQQQQ